MDTHYPRPRCRVHQETILDQLYTQLGSKREPFGRLFAAPRWTSETTLIAHETMGDGWLVNPYRIELQRHPQIIKLPTLWSHILGSRGAPWQVSPDGRWVLWPKGSPDPNWLCATRIDGSKHLSFWEASHWGRFFGWLPGNHPVYLTSATPSNDGGGVIPRKATAIVYGLHQSKPLREISLPPLEETQWAGISPKGTIVLAGLSSPHRATLAQIVLSGGKATLQRTTISLPTTADEDYFGATLSPDGQRLLWQLGQEGTGQLTISSLEGKHFTRLRVDAAAAEDPQWHPSGRAISFKNEEDLYTLEVG